MDNLINFALDIISKNPNVANNPRSQEMIQVIKSGDAKKGEALAQNLCASYGVSPQQAVQQAQKFFNIP